jgi:hypothetical protein
MKTAKPSYAGIKQLSKEFAITMPKARDALKAAKVMGPDGKPVKAEYAQERQMEDGKIWYSWDKSIAENAFLKAGLKQPSELERYSHVQNKHQADGKIADAFIKIGETSQLEEAYNTGREDLSAAFSLLQGCMYEWDHGGIGSAVELSSKDECVTLINNLHRAIKDYESTCKSICKTQQQIKEVEFYAAAIRRVADWIQLQFFR